MFLIYFLQRNLRWFKKKFKGSACLPGMLFRRTFLATNNPPFILRTFNVIFATEAFLGDREHEIFLLRIHLRINTSRAESIVQILFVFIAVLGIVVILIIISLL